MYVNVTVAKSSSIFSKVYVADEENLVVLTVKKKQRVPRVICKKHIFPVLIVFVLIQLMVMVNDFHSRYYKPELQYCEHSKVSKTEYHFR